MAEDTRTQTDAGQGQPSPGTTGPETDAHRIVSTADAAHPAGQQTQQQPDFSAQLASLQQQNERYQANIRGWEADARKNREENERLRQQLQAQQDQLKNLGMVLTGQQPGAQVQPRTPAEAMQRWLSDGDDNALNNYFTAAVSPTNTADAVNQQLMAALQVLQRQQLPFQMHPELADVKHPTRKAILEAYDEMAQDPSMRMLFGEDAAAMVDIVDHTGQNKRVDQRLLDRAALSVKARARAATNDNASEGIGDTMGASAGNTQRHAEVEPTALFTQSELTQFMDPAVIKALPRDVPRDARGLAKYLVDGMSDEEKSRRMQAYRARQQAARA